MEMKVLGIVCSPRKGGNTEMLVQEALAGAQTRGANTELVTVWDKDIRPSTDVYHAKRPVNAT